jgi:hypothetical protein
MSSHAPHRCEQLSHRRDNRDLARFTRRSKTSVVLAQPRIASHGVENHHPERLAQASVSERNCWTAGEALLARLPQPRCNADIACDRTSVTKARGVSELGDQTCGSQRSDSVDGCEQFAYLVFFDLPIDVAREILQSAAQQIEVFTEVLDP